MYRSQTTKSLVLDCLMIALLPTVVILGALTGIFAYVAHAEGFAFSVDVPFMTLVGALTLFASVGSAACHWAAGPSHVKMTPAEEAAKMAEIAADREFRMAAERARDDEAFLGLGLPEFLREH